MAIQGRFRQLAKNTLPAWAGKGVMYMTSDTNEIFIGQGPGKPLKQNDGMQHFNTFADLPTVGENNKAYLVLADENSKGNPAFYIYSDAINGYKAIEGDNDQFKVGTTELSGLIEFIAGDNVRIEANAGTNTITISSTDTDGKVGTKNVDESNLFDGAILRYNAASGKLLYSSLPSGGGGGSLSLYQLTKLNVEATSNAPREIDLPIDYTTDFLRLPVEILKFTPQGDNIITTEVAFDNADATDFTVNANIIFDGKMHLKTIYDLPVIDDIVGSTTKIMKVSIDKTNLQSIQSIEVI